MNSLFSNMYHTSSIVLIQNQLIKLVSNMYDYIPDDTYKKLYHALVIEIPGYYLQNNIQSYTCMNTKKAIKLDEEEIVNYINNTFKPKYQPGDFTNFFNKDGILVPAVFIDPMQELKDTSSNSYTSLVFCNYYHIWSIYQYIEYFVSYLESEARRVSKFESVKNPIITILEPSLLSLKSFVLKGLDKVHKNLLLFSLLSKDESKVKIALEITCVYNLIGDDTSYSLYPHMSRNNERQNGYVLALHEETLRSQILESYIEIIGE